MINFFPKLIHRLRAITVNTPDRLRIRNALLQQIGASSVRGQELVRRYLYERSALRRIRQLLTYSLNPMPILIGLVVMVLVGGGVAVGAEQSLPGDVLFPVKVTVNEGVMTFIAFSPEAKAKVEVAKTERRLEEIERLAAAGKLDADVAAKIKARLEAQADKTTEVGLRLKANGRLEVAAEVFSDLQAAMDAHKKILVEIGEVKVNGQVVAEDIVAVLRLHGEAAAKARAEVEGEVSAKGAEVQAAAEGKLNAAMHKIAEVRAFVERVKEKAGASAVAEAEARLNAADALVQEGKAKLEADAFGEAFVKFQEALRVAQEAKLLVEVSAETHADIDVELDEEDEGRGNLDLELEL